MRFLLCLLAPLLWAQTPAFEVVSIRPSAPNSRSGQNFSPGGRFTATGMTLKWLIMGAYNIPAYELSGVKGWMESERYDIAGKAPDGEIHGLTGRAAQWAGGGNSSNWTAMDPNSESSRQFRTMMQNMLADRFQLKLHHESRELSVYALLVAKDGSKLQVSKSAGLQMKWGMGSITWQGAPLRMLTGVLSQLTGRPVVDQTGLQDNYDFTLQWTPDDGQMQMFRRAEGPQNSAPDTTGPSIFTALKEQLGLQLEAKKAPVDILVVDQAERPSAN